jgi:putative lipoprotein
MLRRRMFVAVVLCLVPALLYAATPRAAAQQAPLVAGTLPPAGGVALYVTSRAATPAEIVVDLEAQGCRAELVSVLRDGVAVDYVPGAPGNVNRGFPGILDRGAIFVLCGPASGGRAVVVQYNCADNKSFVARVYPAPTERAVLYIDGRTLPMTQAVSGSGIRYTYAANTVVYASQGDEALVQEDGEITYRDCVTVPATSTQAVLSYACSDGKSFVAHVYPVPETRATVFIDGRSVDLAQTISASGIRYTDGALTFHSKGEDAFIEQGGQITYRDCRAQPSVTASITYLERMALPAGAVVSVELQDVSRADAPATVLSAQRIVTSGEQVPFVVGLVYDPAAIGPSNRYVVRATITVDGALWFTTDRSYPVLTGGQPARAELVLRRVVAP